MTLQRSSIVQDIGVYSIVSPLRFDCCYCPL